jgi:formylglycine-generating enzyme required for sulfatase activity
MLLLLKFKLAAAVVLVALIACSAAIYAAAIRIPGGTASEPEIVRLKPGAVSFKPAGDFTRAGKVANSPVRLVRFPHGLEIMRRQVTQAEYAKCVDERQCPAPRFAQDAAADMPMVGVSWNDARAYAEWLSRKSGKSYRLPTDEEWAFAAGSRFRDEGWPDVESGNIAKRQLVRYESEAAEEPIDDAPRVIGSFGANENGLLDLAGNVWEWSDTCFARIALDPAGAAVAETRHCGVRVVEGRHRTYVTDFIRDARAGGCAVGTPPANLGFRLVRGG